MVSPHIELASTVLECNLRSEAKMFFFSFSFLFFCSGEGWGLLVTCWAERMALCWFVVLQSICVHGIFVLIDPNSVLWP